MESGRFVAAELALNFAGLLTQAECNPGGSDICTTGTKGCDAGLTCVGTSSTKSCEGSSDDMFDLGLDSHILVERDQLKARNFNRSSVATSP
jgi:hypothetical protein